MYRKSLLWLNVHEVLYLRWSYERQPIRRVCWEQSHRLTLVDGQRRAQEVPDQVDEPLEPLLTGAFQQLESWETKRTKDRINSQNTWCDVSLIPTTVYDRNDLNTHWQTWTWAPGWASRPSCRPSWWGRWRWCCPTCTWWTGSWGSVLGAPGPHPSNAVNNRGRKTDRSTFLLLFLVKHCLFFHIFCTLIKIIILKYWLWDDHTRNTQKFTFKKV